MKQIKELLKSKEYESAIDALLSLKERVDFNNSDDLLSFARFIAKLPSECLQSKGFETKKVAFLTGYTSSGIISALRSILFFKKLHLEVYESSFGLFEQEVYSRSPALQEFKPDLCCFFVGTDHLSEDMSSEEAQRWAQLWKAAHGWLGCDILQNTFEEPLHRAFGNFEFKFRDSFSNKIRILNFDMAQLADNYVHFNDINSLSALYGRKNWRDERTYDLSKMPVSYALLPIYAKNLAQIFLGILGKTKKCLVLDLDNTLWGGVVGDDGVQGIEIGHGSAVAESYHRFQNYIKQLKSRGLILAVCSKNEDKIAKEVFLVREDMVLKIEDISCFVANWNPKSENIQEIAKQLNIGLDSMVFVDDNPAERALVREMLPEVCVLEMPEDPADYTFALSSCMEFEITAFTEEDQKRTSDYRSELIRKELLNEGDYSDYLKRLQMRATIRTFDDLHLPRITQLINKTNQFNLTTRRYTQSQVEEISRSKKWLGLYAKLEDRFGDSGLVSLLMGEFTSGYSFRIDNWLMSCRVLKRGLENLLFQKLVSELKARKIDQILGTYIPTEKNIIVKDLFKNFGFKLTEERVSGETVWELDLNQDFGNIPAEFMNIEIESI